MKINRLLVTGVIFLTFFNSFGQQECMLGEMRMFAGNFVPRNWAFCDGQLLPINSNQSLFSVLGTTYGGDGRTTFALPDLRGRSAVHSGDGPGLPSVRLGDKGGVAAVTITTNNLPPHGHTGYIKIAETKGNAFYSNNGYIADSSTIGYQQYTKIHSGNKTIQGVQTNATGGGQPVNVRSPYTGINYIICTQGTFPSRN